MAAVYKAYQPARERCGAIKVLPRHIYTYTGHYSEDGENRVVLGEHTRDLSQMRVGVRAAQAPQGIPAAFDYFTLAPLEE